MFREGRVATWALAALVGVLTLGLGVDATAGIVGSKFDMSLYGYVKLDAVYNTQRTPVNDILLFVLPQPAGEEREAEFAMTARQSRFGFNIMGPADQALKTTAKVEAGFWGEQTDQAHKTKLRLRLAYADIAGQGWSVRAGQDWDTFITVIPNSVNFTYFGWQGSPGYRRPQLRVTKDLALTESVRLSAKVALARSLRELYQGVPAGYRQNEPDVPEVQGNLMLQARLLTDTPARISVSGSYGRESFDTPEADNVDFNSELLMGSLYLPLLEMDEGKSKLAVQGAVWQGKNLDAYEAGIGLGINLAQDTEIGAKGGWGQLLYTRGKVGLALGYGLDDPDDEDLNSFAESGPNARSRNEFVMGNVSYALNDAVTLAFEVSHLTTDFKDAPSAQNDRFHGAVFYHF